MRISKEKMERFVVVFIPFVFVLGALIITTDFNVNTEPEELEVEEIETCPAEHTQELEQEFLTESANPPPASQPTKAQSAAEGEWYLGPSVNVSYAYPARICRSDGYSYTTFASASDTVWENAPYFYQGMRPGSSTPSEWQLEAYDTDGDDYIGVVVTLSIPVDREGNFIYWTQIQKLNGGSPTGSTNTLSGSTAYTDQDIGADNHLDVIMSFIASSSGLSVYIELASREVTDQFVSTSTTYDGLLIHLQSAYCNATKLSSQQRSLYQYIAPDQKIHRLNTDATSSGAKLIINSPITWEYLSSTPTLEIQWNSADNYYYAWIDSITTYEILFAEGTGHGIGYGRCNRYACIEEVSWNYLLDLDLETGADWADLPDHLFDEVGLANDVVFAGTSSLRLLDDDSGGEIYTLLPNGSYYLFVSHYINISDGYFHLNYYDADQGGFVAVDLTTSTGSWRQNFIYVEIAGYATAPAVRNLCFNTSDDTDIYIDNFRIYQANPAAYTSGYNQTTLEAQLVSWDGYLDPVVPYEDITLELIDTTTNASVVSCDGLTDFDGSFSVICEGELTQKQYELRGYSIHSWWGTPWAADLTETTTGWDGNAELSTDAIHGDYSILFPNDYTWGCDPAGQWDFSDVDYYSVSVKTNTTTLPGTAMNYYLMTDWSNYGIYRTYGEYAVDTWYTVVYAIPEDEFDRTGSPNYSSVDFLFWNFGVGHTADWSLDNIHCIQAAKSYFTPVAIDETVTLYSTDEYFLLECANSSLVFRTWTDSVFAGDYYSGEWIPKNISFGTHNFSYCAFMGADPVVYLSSETYFIVYEILESFIVFIESFSVSDVYVNLYVTSTKGGSYYIYENDSLEGSGSFQETGTIISHAKDSSTGVINLAYKFVNGSDTLWFNTSYSNAADPDPSWVPTVLEFSYDLAGGIITTTYHSNWGNTTYLLKDNGTTLGSPVAEGNVAWSFTPSYGYHNITLHVNNSLTEMAVIEYGFTYSQPAAPTHRVHFTFVDSLGVGLPFEIALLYVNNSRLFDADLYVLNNTFINVTAYDFFDVLLFNENYTITADTQINVTVELWEVLFRNTGPKAVYLEVYRGGHLGIDRLIEANTSLGVRMLSGSYEYRVYVDRNETIQDPDGEDDYGGGKKRVIQGNFKISAYMPQVVDVTPKAEPVITKLTGDLSPILLAIASAVISGVIVAFTAEVVKNFFVYPAVGRHLHSPVYKQYDQREEDLLDQAKQKYYLR